jgi:hypothetical protein
MYELPTYGRAFAEINALAKDRGFCLTYSFEHAALGECTEKLRTSYFSDFAPGDRKITSAINIIVGVHGIEGHPGHRLLCRILKEKIHLELPKSAGLIITHLVNPFGFSYRQRVDQYNVDPNRGCFDLMRPDNNYYEAIRALVEPKDLNRDSLAALKEMTADRMRFRAAVSGQWQSRSGIFFGGKTTCVGGLHLRKACQQPLFAQLERVVAIDFHTGLGNDGEATVLSPLPSNKGAAADRTRAIFGERVNFINTDESIVVGVNGDYLSAMGRWLPSSCQYTGIGLEMGTAIPKEESFPAIVAKNWLTQHPERAGEVEAMIVQEQEEAFCQTFAPVWDAAWMQKCYEALRCLWQSSIKALS